MLLMGKVAYTLWIPVDVNQEQSPERQSARMSEIKNVG